MARILLADDEAAMRDFVKRTLEADGHEVVVASEGSEAFGLLSADGAAFDLLITDVHMPSMDGLTLAEKGSRLKPGLPILLMSGFAVDRTKLAAAGANVVGIVQKPFTLEQIRAQTKLALRAA
jgi:CheY-like chemotaxis protein